MLFGGQPGGWGASGVLGASGVGAPSAPKPHGSELTPEQEKERAEIASALRHHQGNVSKAAAEMGVSRTTLYKRMERFRLHVRVVVETDDGEEIG